MSEPREPLGARPRPVWYSRPRLWVWIVIVVLIVLAVVWWLSGADVPQAVVPRS